MYILITFLSFRVKLGMLTLAVRTKALMRIDVNDASTENEMAYSTTEKPCLGLVPRRSYP